MNYKEMMKIDRNDLVKELSEISANLWEFSEKASVKRLEVERLKLKLDVEVSKKYLDIKRNPDKYGIAKPTEGAIDAIITTNDEINALKDALAEVKYEESILLGGVKCLSTKKDALSCLVSLHGQGYFSEPKIDPSGMEKVKETEKSERTRRIRQKRS